MCKGKCRGYVWDVILSTSTSSKLNAIMIIQGLCFKKNGVNDTVYRK